MALQYFWRLLNVLRLGKTGGKYSYFACYEVVNLGSVQGKLDAAIRAYDKAIDLDTKLAPA